MKVAKPYFSMIFMFIISFSMPLCAQEKAAHKEQVYAHALYERTCSIVDDNDSSTQQAADHLIKKIIADQEIYELLTMGKNEGFTVAELFEFAKKVAQENEDQEVTRVLVGVQEEMARSWFSVHPIMILAIATGGVIAYFKRDVITQLFFDCLEKLKSYVKPVSQTVQEQRLAAEQAQRELEEAARLAAEAEQEAERTALEQAEREARERLTAEQEAQRIVEEQKRKDQEDAVFWSAAQEKQAKAAQKAEDEKLAEIEKQAQQEFLEQEAVRVADAERLATEQAQIEEVAARLSLEQAIAKRIAYDESIAIKKAEFTAVKNSINLDRLATERAELAAAKHRGLPDLISADSLSVNEYRNMTDNSGLNSETVVTQESTVIGSAVISDTLCIEQKETIVQEEVKQEKTESVVQDLENLVDKEVQDQDPEKKEIIKESVKTDHELTQKEPELIPEVVISQATDEPKDFNDESEQDLRSVLKSSLPVKEAHDDRLVVTPKVATPGEAQGLDSVSENQIEATNDQSDVENLTLDFSAQETPSSEEKNEQNEKANTTTVDNGQVVDNTQQSATQVDTNVSDNEDNTQVEWPTYMSFGF